MVLVVMFLSANTEFHNLIGNTALTTAAQVILVTQAILRGGGGVGIPKLYMKVWWPLFLAMKFTFLNS